MDPAVAGMLGVVLRCDFTQPCFEEFRLDERGGVFMLCKDSAVAPVFLGPMFQVQHALMQVAGAAQLTRAELQSFEELFSQTTGARLYH